MSGGTSGGYFPVYPQHDSLPDPEIRAFITNFYRTSDKEQFNELWVSCFTKDADVIIGNDSGKGTQEIRELRQRMWEVVADRKHVVHKAFPGSFQEDNVQGECELMLHGDVHTTKKDGQSVVIPWAGHAVLVKTADGEKEEWKFKKYRVYIQR